MKTLVVEKIYNRVKELTPEDMNKFSGRIIFYYIILNIEIKTILDEVIFI